MYFKLLPLISAVCLITNIAFADKTNPEANTKVKTTQALRTTQAPVVDGVLEPEVWQTVVPATNFVQFDPINGKPSRQKTEVYMLYDNDAVYIGAQLYDTAPDSILTQLGERDSGENNSDMFGVYLDTYNDKQNAFAFLVSAAGVQTDVKISQGSEDRNWDAVWASSVKRNEQGWVVEMRIPYGAIRFPKGAVQTWGVNYMRIIRRTREKSYWNHVDNSVSGFVNQEGRAIGIESIESPVRLQFTPYVSGYVNHFPSNVEGKSNYSYSVNGGMDVKYGINDAFTLDVTLIPDFGQTQSDNQVLNLSPFEVKFSENRQFFTEGTELFNKAGLFYSRRIGGTPLLYGKAKSFLNTGETLEENPNVSSLVNAAKVSGRTRKGLGIGIFNALTRNMFATAKNEEGETREILTDPFTNYNVFVLDQTLRNNSFVTFTNTNVTRSQGYYDANVSGIQLRFADRTNTYAVRAGGNVSQLFGKHEGEDVTLGHQYNINLAKVSGNFKYSLNHSVESDKYDINDLGFIRNNNEVSTSAQVNYNFYQPIWKFLNWNNRLNVNHSMLYAPREFISMNFGGGHSVKFRSFTSAHFNWSVRPGSAYDYFEARDFPQVFIKPPAFEASSGISTDYRKRLAFDASLGHWESNKYNQSNWWASFNPRFRVNDKLLLINGNNYSISKHDIGYIADPKNSNPPNPPRPSGILADREVKTLTTTLSGAYIFNERTGLTLNLRHYWSTAENNWFNKLQKDGSISRITEEQDPNLSRFKDININYFNIDLVYSWRFAPGSELRVVWKNAIQDRSNTVNPLYFENLSRTIQAPQNNNISVKLLYFIDYIAIKNVLSA